MNWTIQADTTGRTSELPESRVAGEETWWDGILPVFQASDRYVSERDAMRSPALLGVINTLCTDVAALPLKIYRRRRGGGQDEVRDDPRWNLLNLSPDGETTAIVWRQALMAHVLLWGNGYAEIQQTGRGMPVALHLQDPDLVCPERINGRLWYHLLDKSIRLAPSKIFHLAGLGLDGLCGTSFVRLINQAIYLDRAAENFAGDYFANGAEPGVILESPKVLKAEGRARLRAGWNARHQGPGKRHGVAVLEDGVTAKPFSVDPEKSQLTETRKHQVLEVIRAWRVPPHKAGDFSQAHLNNIGAANLDYLQSALTGWLVALEQQANFKLLTDRERRLGYFIEHDVKSLLRSDIATRYAAHSIALRDGWKTRNEVRNDENMNPIPEGQNGDLFTVQAQMIPLRDIGKDAVAPEQAPQSEPNPAEDV